MNWKPIKESNNYGVNIHGEVFSFIKGRRLKPMVDKDGYLTINIYLVKGRYKTLKIHRLVAQAFIENEKDKPQVNHINGDKKDNRVENLEWTTSSENAKHKFDSGLFVMPKGDKAYNFGKVGSLSGKAKRVKQYNREGEFIKEYASIIDAQTQTGVNNIVAACKGKLKSAGSYKWEYSKI